MHGFECLVEDLEVRQESKDPSRHRRDRPLVGLLAQRVEISREMTDQPEEDSRAFEEARQGRQKDDRCGSECVEDGLASSLNTRCCSVARSTEKRHNQKRIISTPDSALALAQSALRWFSEICRFAPDNVTTLTANVENTITNISDKTNAVP